MAAGTRLRMARGGALLLALAALAGCTSDQARSDGETTTTEAATTTTAPPLLLALSPNLDLVANECFAEIPVPTTTPPAGTDSDQQETEGADESATEQTVPDTLPETTTIPRPPTIAIVDCAGSNLGQVFATFCLGADAERVAHLTAVACPGDADLEYPGDRALRRAAARVCLQRFEEQFQEAYAASTRVAQEFVPTQGVWARGDRRVVCHAQDPPAVTTTTSAQS